MSSRGGKVLSFVALGVLICAIAIPIVWTQFISSKSKIPFRELSENGLLDFSYTSEVSQISRMMTQRTDYINRYLINMLPRRGYLNILLVDTQGETGKLSSEAARFVNDIRYQCAALPSEETVACDSRFLDSIDFTGLLLEGDTELRPSLTRSWVIGHEIAHIVLKHGSGAYGFADTLSAPEGVSEEAQAAAMPPSAKPGQCETIDDDGRLKSLFYLEHAADSFALQRLRPNSSSALVDFHHGNWFLELAGEVVKTKFDPVTRLPEAGPKSALVPLPLVLHQHPPMLWRLHTFLRQAERTYEGFAVPALGFVPELEFCFQIEGAKEPATTKDTQDKAVVKRTYYQNGFYVDGPTDKSGTRLLGQLVDDLIVVHAEPGDPHARPSDVFRSLMKLTEGAEDAEVVGSEFCPTIAKTLDGHKLQPLFGDDTCFAVVLSHFVNKDACPPDSYLAGLYGEQGTFSSVSDRPTEDTLALAALTSLLAKPCLPSQGLERVFAATLNASQVLAAHGASGMANLLLDNFTALAVNLKAEDLPEPAAPDEVQLAVLNAKLSVLWQIRDFARTQAWFPELAEITQTMLSTAESSQAVPAIFKLSLEREKLLVQMENGLVDRAQGIDAMKDLFSRIVGTIDAGKLDGDEESNRYLAFETANHVLFFTNLSISCSGAPEWAAAAYEQLRARFDIAANPPEKLISSWVSSANCTGADLAPEIISQSRTLAAERLARERAAGDVVAAEDALRGFVALAVYHYVHGDLEQARRDIRLVMAESAVHAGRTEEAKFLDLCSPAIGRCVKLRDISDGIPFDPERYEKLKESPGGISWEVVEG